MTESSEAYELSNAVETALAKALVLAAEAKRWDVVMQSRKSCSSRLLMTTRARALPESAESPDRGEGREGGDWRQWRNGSQRE